MIGSDLYSQFVPTLLNKEAVSLSNDASEPEKMKKIFSVAVEGNIGSGKTTLLNYFKKYRNVEVLVEPVEKWKNIKGFNSLDLMYKDATRWSSAFQSYVTLTMLQNHHYHNDEINIRMTERSVYSARYCFIENLHQSKLMPEIDYAMLGEWHDWIKTNAEAQLDVIVYLQAKPETCLKRIAERNRNEEQGVPLDYLQTLDRLHNDWLIKKVHGEIPAKVMVINTDCNKEDVIKQIQAVESEVMCGIQPIL